jgi:hypothetical protein
MMSVGRLVVFDVTALQTFEAAKHVVARNHLRRPSYRAKYSPRIIIVGDMAKTDKEERSVSYD